MMNVVATHCGTCGQAMVDHGHECPPLVLRAVAIRERARAAGKLAPSVPQAPKLVVVPDQDRRDLD